MLQEKGESSELSYLGAIVHVDHLDLPSQTIAPSSLVLITLTGHSFPVFYTSLSQLYLKTTEVKTATFLHETHVLLHYPSPRCGMM